VVEIEEQKVEVGKVTHYYSELGVAILKLSGTLEIGDIVRIAGGRSTDFTQEVKSMELNHKKIDKANPSDLIGLKVQERVRESCKVYKI